MDLAVEQELAQLQGRQALEQRDLGLDLLQRLGDRGPPGHAEQLLLHQGLVGRHHGMAGDRLDDLVALVDAVLDQRIAGERADHVQPRDVGLVGDADLGVERAAAREGDAAGFEEAARRVGAEPGDDPVAAPRARALGRAQMDRARFDPLRRGVVDALDPAALDRLLDRVQVAGLGAGELGPPVDDDDPVLLGERERVLDRGVAGADDHDRLARVLVRVVELVLHQRQLGAGHVELAQVALDADRQHDVVRLDRAAILERDRERAALALDLRHLGAVAQPDRRCRDRLLPAVEDLLAAAGGERDGAVAVQRQHVRRRHHELAALVLLDGVGEAVLPLEHDVVETARRRAGAGAQAGRSGADDHELVALSHVALSLRAGRRPARPRLR